jgi:hypothetical protein
MRVYNLCYLLVIFFILSITGLEFLAVQEDGSVQEIYLDDIKVVM